MLYTPSHLDLCLPLVLSVSPLIINWLTERTCLKSLDNWVRPRSRPRWYSKHRAAILPGCLDGMCLGALLELGLFESWRFFIATGRGLEYIALRNVDYVDLALKFDGWIAGDEMRIRFREYLNYIAYCCCMRGICIAYHTWQANYTII